jgi:hypothetical protein
MLVLVAIFATAAPTHAPAGGPITIAPPLDSPRGQKLVAESLAADNAAIDRSDAKDVFEPARSILFSVRHIQSGLTCSALDPDTFRVNKSDLPRGDDVTCTSHLRALVIEIRVRRARREDTAHNLLVSFARDYGSTHPHATQIAGPTYQTNYQDEGCWYDPGSVSAVRFDDDVDGKKGFVRLEAAIINGWAIYEIASAPLIPGLGNSDFDKYGMLYFLHAMNSIHGGDMMPTCKAKP